MDNVSHHIIEPYSRRLIIATIEQEKHITEIEKTFGIDASSLNRLGGVYTVTYKGWNSLFVFFNFSAYETLTYGIVSHECLHIVDEMFNTIDHDYDVENNEPGAYLIEWLVNKVFNHLEKRNLIKNLSSESKIKDINKVIQKIIESQ